jgi:3-phytase
VIEEVFLTRSEPTSNMDSPAVWLAPSGESWVIATGKVTNRLHVYDAVTGAPIRTAGRHGSAPGEFRRPNGIAVVGDIALVVERDNARVQALRLPAFDPVTTFGGGVLRRPYGIGILEHDSPRFEILVTDDYRGFLGRAPRDGDLGERVKRFRVTVAGDRVDATYLGAFGDTAGAGRLRKVESIATDPASGAVLIADEEGGDVKVYDSDGSFTGRVLWGDVLRYEPEGIALYACDGMDGYWIVADQHRTWNRFLIFDRATFEPIGAFTGAAVRNTDGIALVQQPVGAMGAGVLYAVHNDRAVGAFAWSDIAAALGLRDDCADNAEAVSERQTAAQIEPVLFTARVGDTHRLAETRHPEPAAETGVPAAIAPAVVPYTAGIGQAEQTHVPAHEQRH